MSSYFSKVWTGSDEAFCGVTYSLTTTTAATPLFTETTKATISGSTVTVPTSAVFAPTNLYVYAITGGQKAASAALTLEVYLDCVVSVTPATQVEHAIAKGARGTTTRVTLGNLFTFASNDTTYCPMDTVTVYSDAGYTTVAQAAVAVSGATFTTASDTPGCTLYYVQGTNTNGDYARNVLKLCVCGLEVVSVPDTSTFVQTSYRDRGSDTIAGATVRGWFREDFSNAGTIASCGIQTYALYTDADGTAAWSDTAKVTIAGT